MAKFEFKMKNLIETNSEPFLVTRTVSGGLQPDGSYEEGGSVDILMNLLITTAKKEDYSLFNIGNTSFQLVKIRQLKSEKDLIKQGDKLTFEGFNFKVVKPKLYLSHFSDFNVEFAITEADAT